MSTPTPMATGDDAVAAGMALVPGTRAANEIDTAINETRDYIANGHARWKPTLPALPIAKGGTAATTAAAARTALGLATMSQAQDANTVAQRDAAGNLVMTTGYAAGGTGPNVNHLATRGYVDDRIAGIVIPPATMNADGPTGTAYNRNATGSGFFAVWMNAQLQFMRNTSSRRFKQNIRDWTGSVLGLRPVIFDRRGKDANTDEVGFIAEEVGETLSEALVYFGGKVDGIQDRVILAAVVADVQRLAARIAVLEAAADGV